jgi:hypothetical protein
MALAVSSTVHVRRSENNRLLSASQFVGSAPATGWDFTGTSAIAPFTLPAGGGQQTFSDLDPGQYTISETTKEGYTTSVSCTSGDSGSDSVTVNLEPDGSIIYTFTNTLVLPPPTPPAVGGSVELWSNRSGISASRGDAARSVGIGLAALAGAALLALIAEAWYATKR